MQDNAGFGALRAGKRVRVQAPTSALAGRSASRPAYDRRRREAADFRACAGQRDGRARERLIQPTCRSPPPWPAASSTATQTRSMTSSRSRRWGSSRRSIATTRQRHAFSSYAVPTMEGEIRRYFRDYTWSVRVPRDLQERAVRLERDRDALSAELGRARPRGSSPTGAAAASRNHRRARGVRRARRRLVRPPDRRRRRRGAHARGAPRRVRRRLRRRRDARRARPAPRHAERARAHRDPHVPARGHDAGRDRTRSAARRCTSRGSTAAAWRSSSPKRARSLWKRALPRRSLARSRRTPAASAGARAVRPRRRSRALPPAAPPARDRVRVGQHPARRARSDRRVQQRLRARVVGLGEPVAVVARQRHAVDVDVPPSTSATRAIAGNGAARRRSPRARSREPEAGRARRCRR